MSMIGEWLPDGLQDCWQGLELGAEADCATSLNSAGEGGRTMLHVAVDRGLTAVVNWLIQRGGNVDAKDHTGSTPLHVAAAGGNSRLLGLLIKKGARIDAQDNLGRTPLHVAVEHNRDPYIAAFNIAKARRCERKTGVDGRRCIRLSPAVTGASFRCC